MFERFTDKSIKVILLAQEESRRLGQKFVGSEQMLVGLIAEDTSFAASILKEFGLTLPYARAQVEKIIGRGPGFVGTEIPFTPTAKKNSGTVYSSSIWFKTRVYCSRTLNYLV